jgi:hypothetical protein
MANRGSGGSFAESGSTDSGELQSLQLKLRLSSEPESGAYRVTIELSEVGVEVEVHDADLRRAVRTAADRCAEGLRDRGFAVTAPEVLAALENALENSELVRTSGPSGLN